MNGRTLSPTGQPPSSLSPERAIRRHLPRAARAPVRTRRATMPRGARAHRRLPLVPAARAPPPQLATRACRDRREIPTVGLRSGCSSSSNPGAATGSDRHRRTRPGRRSTGTPTPSPKPTPSAIKLTAFAQVTRARRQLDRKPERFAVLHKRREVSCRPIHCINSLVPTRLRQDRVPPCCEVRFVFRALRWAREGYPLPRGLGLLRLSMSSDSLRPLSPGRLLSRPTRTEPIGCGANSLGRRACVSVGWRESLG